MSKRSKIVLLTLLCSLTSISHAHAEQAPAVATVITNEASAKSSLEMQLLMQASTKVMEVLTAQLDGDQVKLEKSVSEAVAIYDKLLLENPNNVKALNGRAAVNELLNKGNGAVDYKKSIEISTQAITLDKNSADSYYNRAAAYRGLKMYPEARADYQEAIKLNPSRSDWATALKAMEIEAK